MNYKFDVLAYLESLDIRPKVNRAGYVYTLCPECDISNPHLWINVADSTKPHACWGCWKNEQHRGGPLKLIVHLEGLGWHSAREKLHKFSTYDLSKAAEQYEEEKIIFKEIKLPEGLLPATESREAMNFLKSRNFGEKEVQDWGLQYADAAVYGKQRYIKRLFIPVYFQDKLVAFQARDVTNRQKVKYLGSPREDSSPINRVLYNADRLDPSLVVLTEGAMDAWAVGPEHGACLFGKKIYDYQCKILYEMVGAQMIIVALDGDAYSEAEGIAMDLRGVVPRVDVLEMPMRADPADMGHKRLWGKISAL